MRRYVAIFIALAAMCFYGHPLRASEKGMMKGSGSYMEKEMKDSSKASMNGAVGDMSAMHVHDHMNGQMMISPEAVTANAKAKIKATTADSQVSGTALLKETDDGLYVEVELSGVPQAGKRGIHIHQNGSCDDGGNAAGGHYNPEHAQHGYYPDSGMEMSHPGDMGNIAIDANGNGHHVVWLPGISLTSGKYNVAGRAIILHEKEDDFGQPTGNAGGRIGCGTIKLTSE